MSFVHTKTAGFLCALALGAAATTVTVPGIAQAASPTVAVSPTSGSPGAGLTVTGSNWTPGDPIFVQIGSTSFDNDVACVLTVASDGTILGNKPNASCQVPNVRAGSQKLFAVDESNMASHATGSSFTVVPGLTLTPSGASAGTPASPGATVSVQGHGFAASSTVSAFKMDGTALATTPASVTTDTSGNFTSAVSFTVPSTTAAGAHTITATDAATHTGQASITIFKPTLTVTPTSGTPGTNLTFTGSGWAPGDAVFIQIGSTTFDNDVACVATPQADGTILANGPQNSCRVPAVGAGPETLFAVDEQNQGVRFVGTNVTVKPGLTITPVGASAGTPASPGASVSVQGSGWAPSSTVSAFKLSGVALTTSPPTVNTDPSGTFLSPVTFTVPAATTAGTKTLTATDGASNTGSGSLQVFKPKILVKPASGSPGAGLTVTGSGWPAADAIFVQIGSTTFDTDVACVLTAAPDGTIAGNTSTGCRVPTVPAGTQTLFATDEQRQGVHLTGANFTVKPGMVLTPGTASAGSPASPTMSVSIQGKGWAPLSTVSGFKLDGHAITTTPASASTDSSGTFTTSVTFTVPAATTAGTHTLTAKDSASNLGTVTFTVLRPTLTVSPASGAPGAGLTVTGSGWTPGDAIFVQIGSTSFDADVACVLTAASDGTIAGNKPNGNCQVPSVATGSQPLYAIDEQQQGVAIKGPNFNVT